MGAYRPATKLLHPALGGVEGTLLEQASLSDQERIAIVFQGAALLAHLENCRWYLPQAWAEARVTKGGQLKVGAARPGRFPETQQELLSALLLRTFRTENAVAGRGEARLVARRLLHLWRQTLLPLRGDRAVEQILALAPFLWQPPFGGTRSNLLAEHGRGRKRSLWLAGPGQARNRFLAGGQGREEIESLLRGETARDLWDGASIVGDPVRLARQGRLSRAIALWRRSPPEDAATRLEHTKALLQAGLFEHCHESLRGQRSLDARLLRLSCQAALGKAGTVAWGIRRLRKARLDSRQTLQLAELAIPNLAGKGDLEGLADWAPVVLRAGRGRLRGKALVLAAMVAGELGQLERMDKLLRQAEPHMRQGDELWRWHRVKAFWGQRVERGEVVVSHAAAALASRRRLPRAMAGRLWSELALGRVMVCDLAGAERACGHALRLLSSCEGPLKTTLAEFNLAEVRLRRGQVRGVETSLRASTEAHRRSENHRSLLYDLELWVRFELTHGRTSVALTRCEEARALAPPLGDLAPFAALAARAQGWLGRPEQAAASLVEAEPLGLQALEQEERPGLFALAGRPERALEEATGKPWQKLWQSILAGLDPPLEAWGCLAVLEPFRQAKVVLDCELIRPATVPPSLLQKAIATFRDAGADPFADLLRKRFTSPWESLHRYLRGVAGNPKGLLDSFAQLLVEMGFPGSELRWNYSGSSEVLVSGRGGPHVTEAEVNRGCLRLSSDVNSPALGAILELLARDFSNELSRSRKPCFKPEDQSIRARSDSGIIGESPPLLASLERATRFAPSDLPVLIQGESGTGKELVARLLHEQSSRRRKEFLSVNCAALPEQLILSELFGHARGAFTGAQGERKGFFESAPGGTVFLDEIGDLPPSAQGMLLRTLQEGEIRRLGESFARQIDVRVVAATHRDLPAMVTDGTFRQDLFFRLKVATISLPALRDRRGDVSLLADYFLMREKTEARLSSSALACLRAHTWPGNVRELQNVLRSAVLLAAGEEVLPRHLELPEPPRRSDRDYHQKIEETRRRLIQQALQKAGGNQAEAARYLGLSRQALSYLVGKLGID